MCLEKFLASVTGHCYTLYSTVCTVMLKRYLNFPDCSQFQHDIIKLSTHLRVAPIKLAQNQAFGLLLLFPLQHESLKTSVSIAFRLLIFSQALI